MERHQHQHEEHQAPHLHSKQHKKNRTARRLVGWALIVIVILAVLIVYISGGSAINVGQSGYTGRITRSGSLFSIGGSEYMVRAVSYNGVQKSANIYVTMMPIFLYPTLNVTLSFNNSVSLNYVGKFADMQFRLVSVNASGPLVEIVPLSAGLQIAPSPNSAEVINYSILSNVVVAQPGNALQTLVQANTVTNTTTTVAAAAAKGGKSTTMASTSSSTTTIAQNTTALVINSTLAKDSYYKIILNFMQLYAQSANCTPRLYNTTLVEYGELPSGPLTYRNVSATTPIAIVERIVYSGVGNYGIEFVTKGGVANGAIALDITLNVSTGTVLSDKLGGIFQGDSFDQFSDIYTQTNSVGNACAVFVG
jgi:hypothetical protein